MTKLSRKNSSDETIKMISDLEQLIYELKKNGQKQYISNSQVYNVRSEISHIDKYINSNKKWYRLISNYKIQNKMISLNLSFQTLLTDITRDNQIFLENLIYTLDKSLLSVNGRPLDIYQSSAAIVDEENVLVIAGAGTGKTSTILGKLKYLLIQQRIDPADILVLTYTKATAEDMKNKVHKETGKDIDIFTFHKLGRDIIVDVEKKVPRLTSLNLRSFVI